MELEEKLKWEKEVCGIDRYHAAGYFGQGMTIMIHESGTGHALMSKEIIQSIAPKAAIIEARVSSKSNSKQLISYVWEIDGVKYSFEEAMEKYKPDIISVSFIGTECEERDMLLEKYIERGDFILCNATGNEGGTGVKGMYRNVALNIGACTFMNGSKADIQLMGYSGRDKDALNVDYVGFLSSGSGTSAACPFVASVIALFMSRFGKVSQKEFQELIKPYCMDLGKNGIDCEYGDGLIVLPEVFEKDSGYTDVKGHYAEDAIKWGSDKGLINGFPDGSFRPDEPITRGQLMVVLKRYDERRTE